jgi:hypothetical protein
VVINWSPGWLSGNYTVLDSERVIAALFPQRIRFTSGLGIMVAGERIGYLPPSALRWGHVNDNEGREVARIKDIGWARCYVADIEPSLADLCARWPLSRASSARRTALVRAAASSAADSVHAASHESGRAPPVALWAIGNAAVGLAELSLRAGARPAVSLGAAVTGSRERQRVSAICAPRDNDSPLHLGVEPPVTELGLGEGVVISHRRPRRTSETTALSS